MDSDGGGSREGLSLTDVLPSTKEEFPGGALDPFVEKTAFGPGPER